jgi:hypothetical protein
MAFMHVGNSAYVDGSDDAYVRDRLTQATTAAVTGERVWCVEDIWVGRTANDADSPDRDERTG